jgi:hypothetical protein
LLPYPGGWASDKKIEKYKEKLKAALDTGEGEAQ